MTDRSEPSGNTDFQPIEQRLRDERPRPTGEELERARRIALSSSRGGRQRAPRLLGFRPGLARTAMVSLISGAIMVAGSSVTLAVSGISGDGSAGTAQYRTPAGSTVPGGDQEVLGEQDPGGLEPGEEAGDNAANAAEPERQVASAGDDSLPFTGLVMIPLLVLGSVLLVSGFVLRRRAQAAGRTA